MTQDTRRPVVPPLPTPWTSPWPPKAPRGSLVVLQWRLGRGDLSALLDPLLALELVASPGAEWWRYGFLACLRSVARGATYWQDKSSDPLWLGSWVEIIARLRGLLNEGPRAKHLQPAEKDRYAQALDILERYALHD